MHDLQSTDVDILVAGAGPAGVAAAVAVARRRPDLAAQGRIACFDKVRFPREKPCGGGLTGHARAALDHLGLKVRVPAIACDTGRIVYGGEARVVGLERPVEVVRREEFDADLVAQARDAGVVVVEGEGVAAHSVSAPEAVVSVTTTAGRVLSTRVLVAADGAGSRIRRELTATDPRRPARPLRLVKLEIPAPRDFGTEMIYDFSPMAEGLRGYVWLFPVAGGRLNVGAMHTTTQTLDGAAVQDLLGRTLARHGVQLPRTARGWPAWPYTPRGRIAGPHVLCVGDAAGIDALTGEGIAVGLEHGPIAAEAIDHALGSGNFAFTGYAGAVRRAVVGRELALDDRLARLLYARDGFAFWLSLVLFDARMRSLYAARVCGSSVLSDQPLSLWAAFARHLVAAPFRLRRMTRARAALAETAARAA